MWLLQKGKDAWQHSGRAMLSLVRKKPSLLSPERGRQNLNLFFSEKLLLYGTHGQIWKCIFGWDKPKVGTQFCDRKKIIILHLKLTCKRFEKKNVLSDHRWLKAKIICIWNVYNVIHTCTLENKYHSCSESMTGNGVIRIHIRISFSLMIIALIEEKKFQYV